MDNFGISIQLLANRKYQCENLHHKSLVCRSDRHRSTNCATTTARYKMFYAEQQLSTLNLS